MDNTQRINELIVLIQQFKHNPFKYALYSQELMKLQAGQGTTPKAEEPKAVEPPKVVETPKAKSPTKGKRGRAGATSGKDIGSDSQAQTIISDSGKSWGKKNAELTKLGYSVKDIAEATNQRADVVRMDVYRAKKKGLI